MRRRRGFVQWTFSLGIALLVLSNAAAGNQQWQQKKQQQDGPDDTITFKTGSSLVRFSRTYPILSYFVIDAKGIVSSESFDVKLLSLQEICPTAIANPLECVTVDLLSLEYLVESSTLPESLEYNPIGKYYYYEYSNDSEYVPSINYTIPGVGKFIFQIFPHDTVLPHVQYYRQEEELMLGGSVKFSMFLGGWNFVSLQSKLRLTADVSVEKGMYGCILTDPKPGSSNEFILSCNSTELSGTLNLLDYGTSPNGVSLVPERVIVNISKIDTLLPHNDPIKSGSLRSSSSLPPSYSSALYRSRQYEYSTAQTGDCEDEDHNDNGNKRVLRLQSVSIQLDASYFSGALVYDPQISVLLGGGDGGGGGGNGCGSSESLQIGLIISTGVFLIVGLLVVAFVSLISLVRPFNRIIYGKEGSRVIQCRNSQRRASMGGSQEFSKSDIIDA